MHHICPVCQSSFQGRSDKQFCSSECRASFHNQQRKERNQYLKEVNSILKKNRDILQRACPDQKQKVNKAQLLQQGFQYGYITGQYETRQGQVYYCSYEYGYHVLTEQEVLVVRIKPYVQQHLDNIVREDAMEYRNRNDD